MQSKQKTIISMLTLFLAILLAIAAYFGAFIPETYGRDNISMAMQGIGQDLVNLFLIVPLLLIALPFVRKDNELFLLIHAGTVFYVLYSFIIYALGVHFNRLFLVYCAILGFSIYTFTYIIYILSGLDVRNWFKDNVPVKSIAGFLIGIAVLFYVLWLNEIIPAIITDTVPNSVKDYDLPVNPVHVIDIAFVLPGLIIAAILLLKRHIFGYIFTAVALEFIILLTVALIGMFVSLKINGISEDISIVVIFSVISIVGMLFFFMFIKNIRQI